MLADFPLSMQMGRGTIFCFQKFHIEIIVLYMGNYACEFSFSNRKEKNYVPDEQGIEEQDVRGTIKKGRQRRGLRSL